MAPEYEDKHIRYDPNENPPSLVAIGTGLQAAMVIVAPVVLTVVIVARIAGQSDSYLSWAVFAALIISGLTTVIQAVRVGRGNLEGRPHHRFDNHRSIGSNEHGSSYPTSRTTESGPSSTQPEPTRNLHSPLRSDEPPYSCVS